MQTITAKLIPSMLRQQKVDMFENLLNGTGRKGIDSVIGFLRGTDFYDAPASSKFHSNYRGGLLDHSLIVSFLMDKYKDVVLGEDPSLSEKIRGGSVPIVALLHDVCKTCLYVQETKWKKDASNNWMSYAGYAVKDTFPIGHGEKSVIMLQNIGLELEADEMLAIRYHMGMYNDADYSLRQAQFAATEMTPLVPLLQMADYTASSMIEKSVDPV